MLEKIFCAIFVLDQEMTKNFMIVTGTMNGISPGDELKITGKLKDSEGPMQLDAGFCEVNWKQHKKNLRQCCRNCTFRFFFWVGGSNGVFSLPQRVQNFCCICDTIVEIFWGGEQKLVS